MPVVLSILGLRAFTLGVYTVVAEERKGGRQKGGEKAIKFGLAVQGKEKNKLEAASQAKRQRVDKYKPRDAATSFPTAAAVSPPPAASSSFTTAAAPTSDMEMEASSSTALYPQRRCKNIYLVRHAQGIHNVEGDKDHSAYMSPALLDAHITPLGWSQVDCLREHVTKCGLAKKVELVVVSPLMRTLQTAVGVFGGGSCTDGASTSPLLMVEGAGCSGRQAISSLNCPPFLAVEACRERLGVHPCDKRSSITEYRTLFPAIEFSLIENDEDVLWEPDVREPIDVVAARGRKFLDWLWTREENEIAIVTHSSFLDFTLNMYSKECHPTIAEDMRKRFANCELRSMVLVDRSKLGSDTPTCDFPGKIPAGLDLPSDVADKKHIEGNRGAVGCLEHTHMSSPTRLIST